VREHCKYQTASIYFLLSDNIRQFKNVKSPGEDPVYIKVQVQNQKGSVYLSLTISIVSNNYD